ncbi:MULTISPECIES: hypothetical protein [unclassified Paenibacillus]|uniref:hypothetical protein n=1 Tax=unclassified Paenibacillus TaxID=185978 RepID=UPI002406218B|nr:MULTISPECIES: hypothetical protein [unclassified Paenibacillus]MDF9845119.1 hypothetical protein [Paenibacillus sp. PastF-2]MDF9851718.1 hypothetical protein [Paenibacillus sp. PastM-2]MDF9858329.1 hypothetical protein [Paenibacillus sp. PastF-1]MDH6483591.1 hypothetical protein [Paenibacillus sp. PastH-2]MDH6511004.1 hypothetical protein [Paenibacillus sp. PastM-3]
MKLIQDDAQYDRAREALLKMAAELDDPLSSMTAEERERKNLIYDRTAEAIREYRRSEMVVVFPGLKRVYEELGWPYRDFSEAPQAEQVNVPEAPVKHEPKPKADPVPEEPVKPAASRLSGWLDD